MSAVFAIVALAGVLAIAAALLVGGVVCAYFIAIVEARGWPYKRKRP